MAISVKWKDGHDDMPRLHWELDEEAYDAFGRFGVVNEISQGEYVFEQNHTSDALYLLLEGEIGIMRDGREIARVVKNQSFGEMGLLLSRYRSADALALTEGRVLELTRRDIEKMFEEDPVWAARLYRVLAECLAEYLSASSGG